MKTWAWAVHLYTATGLVAAAGIAVFLVRGGGNSFRWAFVLMLAATLIDATDGWLARRTHVKEVLPDFDGRRLDDIIDFQTYTSLPLLFLWRARVLPAGSQGLLLVPLIASAYGFCQASAKTDDGYFLGFPSYWNIVAFYVYALNFPCWLTTSLILAFSLLTFVPSRYLYPSQPGALNKLTSLLGGAWTLMLLFILCSPLGQDLQGPLARPWILASLSYPVYYLATSWSIDLGFLK